MLPGDQWQYGVNGLEGASGLFRVFTRDGGLVPRLFKGLYKMRFQSLGFRRSQGFMPDVPEA